MRWLIRRVTKKGKGAVAYEEDIHYGDVLTIGRGSDQAIYVADIRVALEHARVTAIGGGKYRVESLILAGIRVNDQIVHQDTVSAGALIEIGATKLKLLEPPTDFDAGVELQSLDKNEQKAAKDAKALATTLGQTSLSKRRPSWGLFLVFALVAFLLPAAAHFIPPLQKSLIQNVWQAGDLAAAHHYFGQQCTRCHEKPFTPARDEACGVCHGVTRAHADPAKFNLPELGNARCAHCHMDHNGADGLIIGAQSLCTDCHTGLKAKTRNATQLTDVSDFGTGHPEFQIALPNWDEQGKFTPKRTMLAAGVHEMSGLKFPHEKHLNPKGLNSPDGTRLLECKSCHVAEPGGAKMKPVEFETMCQSCHKLTFSIVGGDREVRHGKVAAVTYEIQEFYAKLALEGGITDTNAPMSIQTRRRPGQPVSQQERQEAYSWAGDKSRQAVDNMFTGKACTICHTVFKDKNESWDVKPVRVAGVWFQKAHFTHGKHTTFVCEDCHQARSSKESSDLLIPGITNCKQCHAGAGAQGKVASECIECHGYHESDHLLLAELQGRGKPAPTPVSAPAKK